MPASLAEAEQTWQIKLNSIENKIHPVGRELLAGWILLRCPIVLTALFFEVLSLKSPVFTGMNQSLLELRP